MKPKTPFPFRLGTTSYIIPAELVENVSYLGSNMEDIELVLFDLDNGPSNIPGPDTIENLVRMAKENDLTYTVHLPLDLYYGETAENHLSLIKAQKVIQATNQLIPWSYIAHLDGRLVRNNPHSDEYYAWVEQAILALQYVADLAGGYSNIALENLEGYPLDFLEPVFARCPVSICVDIGHLWLDQHDPIVFLQKHIERTRVIHLHGVNNKDHTSIAHLPITLVDEIFSFLINYPYKGVLTLEIFGEPDYMTSMEIIKSVSNMQ